MRMEQGRALLKRPPTVRSIHPKIVFFHRNRSPRFSDVLSSFGGILAGGKSSGLLQVFRGLCGSPLPERAQQNGSGQL
jgi:hypothetical protein